MVHVAIIKSVQITLLALLLASPVAGADWTYQDDFSTDKAQSDSFLHSTFWTSDATLSPEPCVQYLGTGAGRGLAFQEYKEQLAEFGYRLPVDAAQIRRMIAGTLTVNVSFPCNAEISQFPAGELFYSISPDGIAWSEKQSLSDGQHTIPIRSTEGTCYIRFSGDRAMIDDVRVSLSTEPATIEGSVRIRDDSKGHRRRRGRRHHRSGAGHLHRSGKLGRRFPRQADHRAQRKRSPEHDHPLRRRTSRILLPSGRNVRHGALRLHDSERPDSRRESPGRRHLLRVQQPDHHQLRRRGLHGGDRRRHRLHRRRTHDHRLHDPKCTASSAGAGLYVLDSTATVVGCTISENSASASVRGGGVYCTGEAAVTLRNCILSANRASAGAGVLVEQSGGGAAWGPQCSVSIVNCTIFQNRLTSASGTTAGGVDAGDGDVTIVNSIVWGNDGAGVAPSYAVSVNYSDIQGGYSGQGNIRRRSAVRGCGLPSGLPEPLHRRRRPELPGRRRAVAQRQPHQHGRLRRNGRSPHELAFDLLRRRHENAGSRRTRRSRRPSTPPATATRFSSGRACIAKKSRSRARRSPCRAPPTRR